MAKRFTDTGKWFDSWFQKLPAKYKLLYLYICDNCDNAGIWEANLDVAGFFCGDKYSLQETLDVLKDKVALITEDKWLVINFIKHQYGTLNPACKPHQSVINKLQQYNLLNENYELKVKRYKYEVKEKEIKKKRKKIVKEEEIKKTVIPTLQEVIDYVKSKGYSEELAKRIFDYYEAGGWKDSSGKPVKSWKQKVIAVWLGKEQNEKYRTNIVEKKKESEDEKVERSVVNKYPDKEALVKGFMIRYNEREKTIGMSALGFNEIINNMADAVIKSNSDIIDFSFHTKVKRNLLYKLIDIPEINKIYKRLFFGVE